MKTHTGNNIKLGVFVTLGTLFLITGIYFVGKKQQLFNNTFRIRAIFKDVSGLQPGNNIRFAGINVGIVEDIQIMNDTSVRVDMLIESSTHKFIKKDSRAIIGSEGLMGNKILIISPGSSHEIVKNNAFIATNAPLDMDDILGKLKLTVDNAALITGDLSQITGHISSGKGTIGKLFMDSTFAEDVDKTVVNIRQGTKGFNQNMEAAKSNILLRGYFRKKEKEKEKQEEQQQTNSKKDDSDKKKKRKN